MPEPKPEPKRSLDEAINDLTILDNALRGARHLSGVFEQARQTERQSAEHKAASAKELAAVQAQIQKEQTALEAVTSKRQAAEAAHQETVQRYRAEAAREQAAALATLTSLKGQLKDVEREADDLEHRFQEQKAAWVAELTQLHQDTEKMKAMKATLKSQLAAVR